METHLALRVLTADQAERLSPALMPSVTLGAGRAVWGAGHVGGDVPPVWLLVVPTSPVERDPWAGLRGWILWPLEAMRGRPRAGMFRKGFLS